MSQEKEALEYITGIRKQAEKEASGNEERTLIRTAQLLAAEATFWTVM